MCIKTKCQCYFSKNMGVRARGQQNNFQLLSDRQWKWSSLASQKYWQIGQDLDANKEIQYTGLVSINKHVSIWLCVCACLYRVFFPVNGRCRSTSMRVCACEGRFRASSKVPLCTGKIYCWHPEQEVLCISHDKTLEMLYLNRTPLFPGRKTNPSTSSESTKSPPRERSATVLGSRSSSRCWDKPHPGRKEGQIPSNLFLADTPAFSALPVVLGGRDHHCLLLKRLIQSLLAWAQPELPLARAVLLLWQPASLGNLPHGLCLQLAHKCARQTTRLPEICQQACMAVCLVLSTCFPQLSFKTVQLWAQTGRRRKRQMR